MAGMQQMLIGASGGRVVTPFAFTASALAVDPADASASFQFGTDGATFSTNWFTPTTPGIGASYWIRATLTSGSTPTGPAMGTWNQLNIARTWGLTRTTVGTNTCALAISIATDAAGTNIVGTGTLTLDATVEI